MKDFYLWAVELTEDCQHLITIGKSDRTITCGTCGESIDPQSKMPVGGIMYMRNEAK